MIICAMLSDVNPHYLTSMCQQNINVEMHIKYMLQIDE